MKLSLFLCIAHTFSTLQSTSGLAENFAAKLKKMERDQSLLVGHLSHLAHTNIIEQQKQETYLKLLLEYIVRLKNSTEEQTTLLRNEVTQLASQIEDKNQIVDKKLNKIASQMEDKNQIMDNKLNKLASQTEEKDETLTNKLTQFANQMNDNDQRLDNELNNLASKMESKDQMLGNALESLDKITGQTDYKNELLQKRIEEVALNLTAHLGGCKCTRVKVAYLTGNGNQGFHEEKPEYYGYYKMATSLINGRNYWISEFNNGKYAIYWADSDSWNIGLEKEKLTDKAAAYSNTDKICVSDVAYDYRYWTGTVSDPEWKDAGKSLSVWCKS